MQYVFSDFDDALATLSLPDFVSRLKQHSALRLRVTKWRNDLVTDTVSLVGSSAAINALAC